MNQCRFRALVTVTYTTNHVYSAHYICLYIYAVVIQWFISYKMYIVYDNVPGNIYSNVILPIVVCTVSFIGYSVQPVLFNSLAYTLLISIGLE